MLPDYHLHTPLCRHATGTPAEFARAALKLGMTEIGFADHNPMPEPLDDWRMEREELPQYLEMIDAVRLGFPELTIRLGLECDFIAGQESWIAQLAGMAPWDFLIGSVHYIAPGWDVDNPKWIGRFREHPVEEIWEMYWRAYEAAIRSGLFDFMAHPDLVKKFGFRPEGDLRRFYEGSIGAAAKNGVAFEINTAGLRIEVHELYPAREFLEMAFGANIPILINSDAHAPGEVGADFAAAIELAREVGYRNTLRFAGRKSRLEPI